MTSPLAAAAAGIVCRRCNRPPALPLCPVSAVRGIGNDAQARYRRSGVERVENITRPRGGGPRRHSAVNESGVRSVGGDVLSSTIRSNPSSPLRIGDLIASGATNGFRFPHPCADCVRSLLFTGRGRSVGRSAGRHAKHRCVDISRQVVEHRRRRRRL